MIDFVIFSKEHFENWLSFIYSKLDCESCNAITLLRYKLKYREQLNIVEIFMLIALCECYLRTYGKIKSKD